MLLWTDLETTGLTPGRDQILEVAAIITDDQLNEVARFERVVYYEHAAQIVDHCEDLAARFDHWRSEESAAIISDEERAARLAKVDAVWNDTKSALSPWYVTGAFVEPVVVKMHWDNGLWRASRRGENISTVDADLREFVSEHGVKTKTYIEGKPGEVPMMRSVRYRPELAGSTISFDREFMRAGFPRTMNENKETGVLSHRNVDVSTMNELARRFWDATYKARPGVGTNAKHRGMDDILASIEVLKYYVANVGPRQAVS